jgi:hypothetical protein
MVCNSEVNTITIILITSIIIYLVFNKNSNTSDVALQKKIILLDEMIKESKKNVQKKINIKENLNQEYASTEIIDIHKDEKQQSQQQSQKQQSQQQQQQQQQQMQQQINPLMQQQINPLIQQQINPLMLANPVMLRDQVSDRDRAVINDELYPPLGRTERPIFDQLINGMSTGVFSYPTRGSPDTFRLVAYLVNTSDKKDMWKLFGRQKYPGSSIGDYYAIQMDDRRSDLKITIKDEMMPKDKIRDIYGLPNEVVINSPLFNPSPYKIIELDKADLTSPYL